jgi:DNA-binding GntR family transcriptional regulator
VQAEIERLILAGDLAPGAKLTEAMLADRLGVSRGPMREAFRILEEAGLVRLEKNRGVFVRSIPLQEAMEIYDLRADGRMNGPAVHWPSASRPTSSSSCAPWSSRWNAA